ncbi:hypothetical protein D3C73_1594490 [compost metagenome]
MPEKSFLRLTACGKVAVQQGIHRFARRFGKHFPVRILLWQVLQQLKDAAY